MVSLSHVISSAIYADHAPGCHDNGYATTLRSQITAGFKHKLILLPTYTEIAAGIAELELPSFTIPELFQVQKIGTQLGGSSTSGGSPTLSPRKGTLQGTAPANGPSFLSQDDENPDNGSGPMVEPEIFAHQSPSTITYASTVLTGQKRASMDSNNSNHISASGGTRHLNPNLVSSDYSSAILIWFDIFGATITHSL